ncbi:hypothetical protein KLPMCK381M_22200 [Klebsiella pneumoniae]
MYRTVFILALSCVMLNGCSTSKEEMLPAGDNTMLELWNGADGGGSTSRQSAAARDTLRRPLTGSETQADRSYSRTQESEITQQFPRLPNPDMVMYLYPIWQTVTRRCRVTAPCFRSTARRSMPCLASVRRPCNAFTVYA